jgi:hypothetical protein
MNEYLRIISRASMAVPAILAIVRYRSFLRPMQPFFWLLVVGLLFEISSLLLDNAPGNAEDISANIYIFFEFQLILWLFYRWHTNGPKRNYYAVISVLAILIWVFDNIILSKITVISEIVRIFNAFVISLLAIHHINRLLVTERSSLLKNPAFIICCAFVFYFSYKILVEVFYMHTGGYFSPTLNAKDPLDAPLVNLARNIYSVHDYVNTLYNFILTYAVICIPLRPGSFSRPSS